MVQLGSMSRVVGCGLLKGPGSGLLVLRLWASGSMRVRNSFRVCSRVKGRAMNISGKYKGYKYRAFLLFVCSMVLFAQSAVKSQWKDWERPRSTH